ncbi:NNP family nitrate/nitrite transporter-like MFS transporter [Agromyces flavus]|uniref:MFS transporter, NNP family, nitrate/nitrite transporter n=1 Tax=Agromyces flavus TaxID=589382 RepID=A0A1H1PZ84_9MICO|nr:MFS transporter [Agromyces flavus]MCP2367830.1 NNP family nitrate/nitrite transporter-like MFS transporter [Agromyces flavus]GGI47290.1 MFS transporter [Agromyces flavus]SDS16661.1 MFS transporter, NNP family, nitrate/nitrite transporter [Agromyces flavus]
MTDTIQAPPPAATDAATRTASATDEGLLTTRPGRWIHGWDAENTTQWEREGRRIARRNLNWSIFAEFLGFVVWQLWSIVAVALPAAGFQLSTGELFWLISIPSLVGATLRIPYSFLVPIFGGRNWTIISAGLLLAPTIALAICVSNPETPFGVLLAAAALAGFGGGNFASSMSNITYFYPQREKGWALGLNAAGGNLGASVAQFTVPIVITIGAGATLNLPLAGLVWIPLIVVAMFGAWRYMDNLSNAKADLSGSAAALKEPHLWLLSLLYIGTFGSFIGFASVFPKLIADQFPEFSAIHVLGATVSLAFLGALVGSLARPYGGRLSDRFGGARITMIAFAAMAGITAAVLATLPLGSFWLFLGLFLMLFATAGIGNGSTYRMVPIVFAMRSGRGAGDVSTQRKAAAALGLISAIGAYGGFLIPQALNLSFQTTGNYAGAFLGFIAGYVVLLALTWAVYVRPRHLREHKI